MRFLFVLALVVLTACEDRLPTTTDPSRFPGGALPTTLETVLGTTVILEDAAVHDAFSDPRTVGYYIVADDFDGALDAHALARFPEFPDSLTYSVGGAAIHDTVVTVVSAEITTVVDAESSSDESSLLQLRTLAQPWDSLSVSWEYAIDNDSVQVPWAAPGGTPGELLAQELWTPRDTAAGDTVVFQLDSATAQRLAASRAAGVMLTTEAGRRLRISRLRLRLGLRPESTDTVIEREISGGARTFVFSPDPPEAPRLYRVGGVTEARTILRLDLSTLIAACADPETEPNCPRVPLRDISINEARLELTARPVPSGFRPLGPSQLVVRRVVEPELGRLAPLGAVLGADTVTAEAFAPGAEQTVGVDLTSAIRRYAGEDPAELTVALLGEGDGSNFGYQWYAASPRIRIIYTLPIRPTLP